MSTNANDREVREFRELSVQELETVTGGAKRQENQEQTDAARICSTSIAGRGPSLTLKEVAERRRVAAPFA